MPTAHRYMQPGYAYHIRQQCHNQQWLLKPARVRDEYRSRLRATLQGSGVSLLSYCLTSSHVHLITAADEPGQIAALMRRQQGEFAKWYNRSRGRSGAFWNEKYRCTMIDTGEYMWNCMRYVDLNMVRAGAARHPGNWRWCGYDEVVGLRKRYRLLDIAKLLELTGCADAAELAANYQAFVEEALTGERLLREPHWTESIAVGSDRFVAEVAARIRRRVSLEIGPVSGRVWAVREPGYVYGPGA